MNTPRCSCPTRYDERTGDIVRAGTDWLCPIHGHTDAAGKCKACGQAVPIVQTIEVARAQAEGKKP